jgi:NAD+ synthase
VKEVGTHIVDWLKGYCEKAQTKGFVVDISGGVDSALTSTLCAQTGKLTVLVSLPILQDPSQQKRAERHMQKLKNQFANILCFDISLTEVFQVFKSSLQSPVPQHELAMANARSRLRMTTLYAIAQAHDCLVVGTGNKVEDFGVGFFTKYGDGGVDLSPIADLTKSQVWQLEKEVGVLEEIIKAKPTDGLWGEDRTDEEQLGASYPELEWAMDFKGSEKELNARQKEVLRIFRRLNAANQHKMNPIPVCKIPEELKR